MTTIVGNFIGLDPTGNISGSGQYGVSAQGTAPLKIGGSEPNSENIISGAHSDGVNSSNPGCMIIGNKIGTNSNGNLSRGRGDGISLGISSTSSTIGGSASGLGNVISGNSSSGIWTFSGDNIIEGNLIGVQADGTSPLGNNHGISLSLSYTSDDNVVGGMTPESSNIIAHNEGRGIVVTGVRNRIQRNQFFFNGLLAIDLDGNGPTPNDPGDGDGGANWSQNTPVITNVEIDDFGDLLIAYHVDTAPTNATYNLTIEFFEADSIEGGEGRRLLGTDSFTVTDFQNGGKTINLGDAVALNFGPLIPLVATATDMAGNTSEFSRIAGILTPPATLVVNTVDDDYDNRCDATHCSLREAIAIANFNVGAMDVIEFNISGSGPHLIQPNLPLPVIIDPLVIDGTTQPGFSGAPSIALDSGSLFPFGTGLDFRVGSNVIRGLSFGYFNIGLLMAGTSNSVQGCFFGLAPDGVTKTRNNIGIRIESSNNIIGGNGPGEGNVVAGNQVGVEIAAQAEGNTLIGNLIGVQADGVNPLENDRGVVILGSHNTIGGDTPESANVIAYNGAGVSVGNSSSASVAGNRFGQNRFFGNGFLGIDLGNDGPSANDPADPDEGPNRLQNKPVIVEARINAAGDLHVIYQVDSDPANAAYDLTVGFYEADALVEGEGRRFLFNDVYSAMDFQNGDKSLNLGSAATLNIEAAVPIVATATDDAGNTSEFSETAIVLSPAIAFTVNTVDDNFDGRCDATHCSLREAIAIANINTGEVDMIAFDIPGAGPHTIQPNSPLPEIVDPVVIDATSQPGYAGLPLIAIDGVNLSSGNGLALRAGNSVIKALSITRFVNGIKLEESDGNQIQGNFIGVDPTGLIELGNGNGIDIRLSSNNQIGGTNTGDGNLISGNDMGVRIDFSSHNQILGNLIGTDVTGQDPLGNVTGIFIPAGMENDVGGPNPGERNVISGNRTGIGLNGSNNRIQGNFIGVDIDGLVALGNERGIDASGDNLIGGDLPQAGNVISGNQFDGVHLEGGRLEGNIIGLDASGLNPLGNGRYGVFFPGFGSLSPPVREVVSNLISANGVGVFGEKVENIAIEGNIIGLDASGSVVVGNAIHGVHLSGAANVRIGGLGTDQGNTISGNGGHGLLLEQVDDVRIRGNAIGTDAAGMAALGNGGNGVQLEDVENSNIGGTEAGAGNVISGNALRGVYLLGETTGVTLQQNLIGLNRAGDAALSNGTIGVELADSSNNLIGGTAPGADNVISGNGGRGLLLQGGGAVNNRIQGNFIGTDAAGLVALPNVGAGVEIGNGAASNKVGGNVSSAGNLISGNLGSGVALVEGAVSNRVEANHIGRDAAGAAPIPYGASGVFIHGAQNNAIGGPGAARNLISGNNRNGVSISLKSAVGNRVDNNWIGVQGDGLSPLGNRLNGVAIEQEAGGNRIGVTAGNTIAHNGAAGVLATSGLDNRFSRNRIHDNRGLGVDLNGDGVSPNDPGDGDLGPNALQNYPTLIGMVTDGAQTMISGTLNSEPNSVYTLEFFSGDGCDASGYGEGRDFVGEITVNTDATGVASFMAGFPAPSVTGSAVAATAADARGSTSEFSACLDSLIFADSFETGDASAWALAEGAAMALVSPAAAFRDSYGLRVMLDGAAAYVQDDSPAAETRYRARFYLRLDDLALPEGDTLDLLTGHAVGGRTTLALSVRRQGGVNQLIASAGLPLMETAPVTLGTNWRAVELAWRADAGQGSVTLLLDGRPAAGLTGIDNGVDRIDFIRWGALGAGALSATGGFDLDTFESRRGVFIGVLGCLLDDGFFTALPNWPIAETILSLTNQVNDQCQ